MEKSLINYLSINAKVEELKESESKLEKQIDELDNMLEDEDMNDKAADLLAEARNRLYDNLLDVKEKRIKAELKQLEVDRDINSRE